jgi:hypothetical protein
MTNETKGLAVTPDQATEPKTTDAVEAPKPDSPKEIGGPRGPEPTRYNDWERNGRCSDF